MQKAPVPDGLFVPSTTQGFIWFSSRGPRSVKPESSDLTEKHWTYLTSFTTQPTATLQPALPAPRVVNKRPPERTPQCNILPEQCLTPVSNSTRATIVNKNIYCCCGSSSRPTSQTLFIYLWEISAVRIYFIPQSLEGPQII